MLLFISIKIYLKKRPSKSSNFLKPCIKSRIWVWDYLKSKRLKNKWKTWCCQHPPCYSQITVATDWVPLFRVAFYTLSLLIFLLFSSTAQKTLFFLAISGCILGPFLLPVPYDFPKLLAPRTRECARCCRDTEWWLKAVWEAGWGCCWLLSVTAGLVKHCSWQGKTCQHRIEQLQVLGLPQNFALVRVRIGFCIFWRAVLQGKKKSMLGIECTCFLYKLVVI